jgi:hypothetical protein
MRAFRALTAGLLTLLLAWSGGATAPTAAAADDLVAYTVGCGFVELTSHSADPLVVAYKDPRKKKLDGVFDLAASEVRHIRTSRTQFIFGVFDAGVTQLLQESPILRPQNCPKVTFKTPRITGKTRVGEVLTATISGLTPADAVPSYQWYRSGKMITGATTGTYTLTKSDKGRKITVKVTGAHDGYFSVAKTSKKTSKIKAGILVTTRPTIDATPVVDSPLTANPGVWGPVGVQLSYQWYRGGKKISKATQQVYTPGTSDLGRKLSVKVTGRLAGYNTVARISAPTVKVIVIA